MNRAVMLRIAACASMGLGAALLIASLLLWTYTAGRIAKIPLDIDVTLVSDGIGTALDPASLSGRQMIVNQDVPLVSQQQITVEAPANADLVTLQAGSSVRRIDKQRDGGLLLAVVDTVTLNRTTALAVSDDSHGFLQEPRPFDDDSPPVNRAVRHEGLSYRFPFATQKQSYQYFDPVARQSFNANYDGEDDVNALPTYRFTQNIGYAESGELVDPVRYTSLYDFDEESEVTATASMWDIGGDPDEEVTMNRYYAAQRTFWVDPVSGTIVKVRLHANHYFARDPLRPEVTLADYTVISTEETVEAQVNAARNERDRLALWSRVLPITFTAAGLIALIGGAVLGWFSVPTEDALTGRRLEGEGGLRGGLRRNAAPSEPTPGAEATTEKMAMRPSDRAGRAGPAPTARPARPAVQDAPGPGDRH